MPDIHFSFRTTRDQSTNPTQVLSCTCTPPQWLALSSVAPLRRLGRPCRLNEAPRIYPRPFSISRPDGAFVRLARDQASERHCHIARKFRLQGLATLLTASAFRPTGAFLSSPRSWALPSRAFFRSRGRSKVSRRPSALTLSCQTARLGTGASAVHARETSGTLQLPHPFRAGVGTMPS
jgi:hypothetical protein